jgi:predicted MPP superfamily phosphohydrolase
VAAILIAVFVHWRVVSGGMESEWAAKGRRREWLRAWRWLGAVWVTLGILFGIGQIGTLLGYSLWREWVRGLAVVYGIGLAGAYLLTWMLRPAARFDPGKRAALAAAVPVAVCGYGVFVERNRYQARQVDIPVPGLAKDLDGLRIAQLTDIHYGAYLGKAELERAVAMANEWRAHVAVVTGDLISIRRDPVAECLRLLPALRAEAGVYGCLGNHEIIAGCEEFAEREGARLGLRFLRGRAEELRFGRAALNLAGVDYQRMQSPYLEGAGEMVRKDALNVLLSHNPDVFPVAAAQGWQVTLAGHTHGGQVNVELLGSQYNVMRFFTPYVYGLYREGTSSIYVSRGLGTVGAPIRLGAPPEVNLIRLCAT